MIRTLTIIAAIAFGGPALALSCLPPDPERMFKEARDAAESFMVVRGAFTPSSGVAPTVVEGEDGYSEWRGQLVGRSLGENGFSEPFNSPITLRGNCLGAWCVSEPPQGPILAFVELAEGGPILTTDSCSSRILRAPTRADLRKVVLCHKGQPCGAAN
jgi:hypothetical protein